MYSEYYALESKFYGCRCVESSLDEMLIALGKFVRNCDDILELNKYYGVASSGFYRERIEKVVIGDDCPCIVDFDIDECGYYDSQAKTDKYEIFYHIGDDSQIYHFISDEKIIIH